MGVRVTIDTKYHAEGLKLRCIVRNDDQHVVFWFYEPHLPGETSDMGPHNRAALAMMGFAQALYEEAAKHLAAHPAPPLMSGAPEKHTGDGDG